MEEEEWVCSMYKKLLRAKNTEERKRLLRGITEYQNRRLTSFIKKKNRIEVTKKVKIKAENKNANTSSPLSRDYRVLVDYTNVNLDLYLTNYVGRVLRINKIKDTHRFTKGLHLYMNILCGIIFKKFNFENKNTQTSKYLLIFLKQMFPVEFKKYEAKQIERWAPNLNLAQKEKKGNDDDRKGIFQGSMKNEKGVIKEQMRNIKDGIIKEEKEDIDSHCSIGETESALKETEKKTSYIQSNSEENDSLVKPNVTEKDLIPKYSTMHILNKNEIKTVDTSTKVSSSNYRSLVKIENGQESIQMKKEVHEKDVNSSNNIEGRIVQNKLVYLIHKELERKGIPLSDDHKVITEITYVLFNENRFDSRQRLRYTIAEHLNDLEYKEFCNLRSKLFKYKRSAFVRWIKTYTKIKHLDLYIVNFFIFLFIDRLNIIIETYIRLNYTKNIDSCESFVKNYQNLCTIDDILDDFCKNSNTNVDIKNNVENWVPSDIENAPEDELSGNRKEKESVLSSPESVFLKKKKKQTKNNSICSEFNKKYHDLVKGNELNFFLALQLIYNLDVHYFKIRNKITFEKLIDINMASYVNDSNVYKLMNFKKGNEEDPWRKFVQFMTTQNSNMKLQKFDYFTVFLVSRFKFYLEEFKENANIDYIYKTIKEEFDEVENFVTCKKDNPDFEHGYLVPLYVSVKREVKKAQEYIKFYGNLTSFVNFIEKYVACGDGPCMLKQEKKEESNIKGEDWDPRCFDLPFFLSTGNAKKKKTHYTKSEVIED